ncbi:eae74b17-050c-4e97-bfeb-879c06058253 [Thermothielavioides terrestris]|uniref:rRNA biogenesis protein RRP36 n=2 Tax=Thermothielavioides terrestris TaxID=2587410 RepID=G2QQR5_THETT|nr:uncharacterized protein THITE_2108306 [Thermothielavioides terrestris NRRL 8126]AEO63275.1 hypothetical protein THITE_2108306 [Thermothielavioides terrestris NRRL 8126]SPQ21235.1 eae74b17-050c-4e97-bfeb-879c06058253 [Thermothielavioides terrestris]
MSSVKRKQPPASLLQRRVRPRYEPEPESEVEDDVSEAPSEEGAGDSGSDDEDEGPSEDESGSSNEGSSHGDSDEEGEEDEDEDEDDEETPQIDASQLSFGALAKAQAAMGPSSRRKRGNPPKEKDTDNLSHSSKSDHAAGGKKPEKRANKHAPVEMSSTKPVSRLRDFLTVTAEHKRPQARDPRFLPLGGGGGGASKIDEIKARKAYAFLDEYRESEMRQLREALGKTKDAAQREKLQRALQSMESRKQAQERRDRERAVLEEHRRREKELVRRGKKPFYLKRSEQKKRLLVEQFRGMSKKQVDKAIERRRKKLAAKEKKLLPLARRSAEDR